jgi:hypothetical protein
MRGIQAFIQHDDSLDGPRLEAIEDFPQGITDSRKALAAAEAYQRENKFLKTIYLYRPCGFSAVREQTEMVFTRG